MSFWTHEWRINLLGEVLRGDEFVQIHFGDELKRFYAGNRKCHR